MQDNLIHENKVIVNGMSCTFYVPHKAKFKWEKNELVFRSLILNEYRFAESSGFPKFFNLGQDKEADQAFYNAKRLFASNKLDGSLLIRSVINDKVHWRTRGCANIAEQMNIEEINSLIAQYPKLSNPELGQRASMLFEYTSPSNKIVIKYEKPSLTLIGIVDLDSLKLLSGDWIRIIAKDWNLPTIELTKIEDVPEFIKSVRENKNIDFEGVVVHCISETGDLTLVKIKSMSYVKRHSIATKLNQFSIDIICLVNNFYTVDRFIDYMKNEDYDDELIKEALELHAEFVSKYDAVTETVSKVVIQVDRFDSLTKEAIVFINDNFKDEEKNIAFWIVRDQYDNIENWKQAKVCGLAPNAYKKYIDTLKSS